MATLKALSFTAVIVIIMLLLVVGAYALYLAMLAVVVFGIFYVSRKLFSRSP